MLWTRSWEVLALDVNLDTGYPDLEDQSLLANVRLVPRVVPRQFNSTSFPAHLLSYHLIL
jgi:hypothetical protein